MELEGGEVPRPIQGSGMGVADTSLKEGMTGQAAKLFKSGRTTYMSTTFAIMRRTGFLFAERQRASQGHGNDKSCSQVVADGSSHPTFIHGIQDLTSKAQVAFTSVRYFSHDCYLLQNHHSALETDFP